MDARKMREAVLSDPSTSYWLSTQIKVVELRDPVDALHDVKALEIYLKALINNR